MLFPWLPVVFLFTAYFFTIKLDVVTANFVSISLVFLIEFARHRNTRKLGEDMMVILKAMAEIFISVVSIIIATRVFAEGTLKHLVELISLVTRFQILEQEILHGLEFF